MTDPEAKGVGDSPPPYMIFLVVVLFFLTGLLGFLICHLLKEKGYRCRTGDLEDGGEEKTVGGHTGDDEDDEHQDTVEQILKCIIENEANMEAFNEMLGNQNVCEHHDPRIRRKSIAGVPQHYHTVTSAANHETCLFCERVRSKKGRQRRTSVAKQRPGEQTVLSVGRFHVTHIDKKVQGGLQLPARSSNALDQPQDGDEQKEAAYKLRSIFKDTHKPTASTSGTSNVEKRRKSVTILELRRGSDRSSAGGDETSSS